MIGKRLTNDPVQGSDMEHEAPLYGAIAALNGFVRAFSAINLEEMAGASVDTKQRLALLRRIADETSVILAADPAWLFDQQCEKEKSRDPFFNRKVFAGLEKMRALAAVSKFEMIPELHDLYSGNPTYKLVLSYINYLDHLPEVNISVNQPRTLRGKHTPEQRNLIREWLIKNEIILNISQGEFEYLFSEQVIHAGMKPVQFLKPASWAKGLLMLMVEGFDNTTLSKYNTANQCILLKSSKRLDSNTRIPKFDVFEDLRMLI